MPIFEPTQIVPSSFTTSETIAVADNVSIQWQINGNSALTAFQIDMYQNTATSEFIYSTGKIGTGYGLPFNGIDRYGRKQYFSYAPEQNWAAWSDNAMTDGNSYKYKITQWFAAVVQVGSVATTRSFSANTTYYFRVTDQSAYVAFTPTSTLASDMANATFYYDFTTLKGWYVNTGGRLVPVSMNVTASAPSGTSIGTTTSASSNEDWIQQVSESAIVTRTTPTLSLAITTGGSETEQNTLISSVAVFTGTYTQAQGVAVRSTHWMLRNESGDLLEDTGVIYTSVVEYMYSGFFNGESYTLSCTVETETGVQVTASIDFTVSYSENTYYGDFTAKSIPREGSVLLQWDPLVVITGEANGDYTQNNGSIYLPSGSSIKWDKERDDPINFLPQWTAAWTGKVKTTPTLHTSTKTVQIETTTGETGSGERGLSTTQNISGSANVYVESVAQPTAYETVSGTATGGSSSGTMRESVSGRSVAHTQSTNTSRLARGTTGAAYTIGLGYSSGIISISVSGQVTSASWNSELGTATRASVTHSGSTVSVILYSDQPNVSVSASIDITYTETTYYSASGSGSLPYNITGYSVTGESSNIIDTLVEYSGASYTWEASTPASAEGQTVSFTIVFSVYIPSSIDYTTTRSYSGITSARVSRVISGSSASVSVNTARGEYTVRIVGSYSGQAVSAEIEIESAKSKYRYQSTTEFSLGKITNAQLSQHSGIDGSITFTDTSYTVLIDRYGSGSVNGVVDLSYDAVVYSASVTNDFSDGTITSAEITATNAVASNVEFSDDSYTVTLSSYDAAASVSANVEISYQYYTYSYEPQGVFFELQGANVSFSRQGEKIYVEIGENQQAASLLPYGASSRASVVLTPTAVYMYCFGADGEYLGTMSVPIQYQQSAISSVVVYGGDSGSEVYNIAIFQGDGAEVLSYFTQYGFEPIWGGDGYGLYLDANFNNNIEGGTGSALSSGFRIYRREAESNVLIPVYSASALETAVKDFGVVSGKTYNYYLYVYDERNAFMQQKSSDPVLVCFSKYTILEAAQSDEDEEYHVLSEFIFRENASMGAVSNNNSPSVNANFTKYPTRSKSVQNYKSGTLSSLIGEIMAENRIGTRGESIVNLGYRDSVELEERLYALSTSDNALFLRDPKGRILMVKTLSPISQSTDYGKRPMPISISLPWVEIGDASDMSLVQTPGDEGWDNDQKIQDVSLDVKLQNGKLYAEYPIPYSGPTFYLSGNILGAKSDAEDAVEFELSATAIEADDGLVSAKVKQNN